MCVKLFTVFCATCNPDAAHWLAMDVILFVDTGPSWACMANPTTSNRSRAKKATLSNPRRILQPIYKTKTNMIKAMMGLISAGMMNLYLMDLP